MKIKNHLPSLVFLSFGMLMFLVLGTVMSAWVPSRWGLSMIAILILLAMSILFTRFEGMSLSTACLVPDKTTMIKLLFGLLIGVLLVGAMLLSLFQFTSLELQVVEDQKVLPFLLAVSVFVPLALMEELLFRGYPFFRWLNHLSVHWVILITAVLFALYHYNGTQSIVQLLLGPGIWGVAFAVAAYLSNSVSLPLGMHISANALQAIFGLKQEHSSLWTIHVSSVHNHMMSEEVLGVTMQIILLIAAVIVLELSIKYKKG